MSTHLIVVGLLCLCGLSLGYGCRRELQVDMAFPGSDIIQLFSPDAEHCQLLCTQHPSCLFFSFLRPDIKGNRRLFYCYLKATSSGQPGVQKPRVGITSGFSLKSCNPDPQPCLSQVYQDVDFPGADYRTLFTTDSEECQAACTQDPSCQFFTFLDQGYGAAQYRFKCHLKFSWPVPKIPTINFGNGRISGFSQRMQTHQHFDSVCQGKLFPSQNIPGHDIMYLPAASPEHCMSLCSAHPQCTYFSHVSHLFRCYLKNNPNAMVIKGAKDVTSGIPARFCQPDNSWMKKTYVGIDFPHSDIRFLLMNDAEECQRTCNEDPHCQYYSYVTEKSTATSLRRRCYLKRVITLPAPPRVTQLANVVSGFSLKNCYEYST